MSKRESIARYNLIIKKIRKKACTFSEIADYLALESEIQSYDFNISKRTFQRDREDILSLYNIDIMYDFSKKVYYIGFEEDADINERILEAFDTFNALNISERLSDYIHFEKRKPLGTEHIARLLYSIKNSFQIKFTYHKYWEGEFKERQVEAYALKEFKNRWYVLAKDLGDNKIKSFALDRLTDLEVTKKKFEYPTDFDVNEHYKYSFGIESHSEGKPEDIILSFSAFQGKYVKSLPLHTSQEILVDTDEELRVKLRLVLTNDFFIELLSFGVNLKVLQPQSLVEKLKSSYTSSLRGYEG